MGQISGWKAILIVVAVAAAVAGMVSRRGGKETVTHASWTIPSGDAMYFSVKANDVRNLKVDFTPKTGRGPYEVFLLTESDFHRVELGKTDPATLNRTGLQKGTGPLQLLERLTPGTYFVMCVNMGSDPLTVDYRAIDAGR